MTLKDLEYKLPPDGKIWGGKYPRPSSVPKVTGTWDFGADLGLKLPPDTLQLALVQAKVSHANILAIDTAEAEKMPGVYKVVTHKDVKGKNRITGLITFPTNKGDGWDRPILCDTKVFQFGDAIAIVCADTVEHAKAAVDKVKVQLEELPAYMSAPAAMASDAIEIHPGTPNIYYECIIEKGADTKPIMVKADFVVEGDYYVGRQPHLPMEPDVGFRLLRRGGAPDHSFQEHRHPSSSCDDLPGVGDRTGKTPSGAKSNRWHLRLQVQPDHRGPAGSGLYGHGQPVFLNFDYFQQITYTGKRSPFFINLKFGADKDGKILAMESDWSCDHGPYSEFGDLVTLRGAQFIGAGYGIPNIRGLGRTVLHQSCLGIGFSCLRVAAERIRFGSPDRRIG